MKTAVEWLYEKVWKDLNFSISSSILDQAKEMEKQQIINVVEYYCADTGEAEQYYNETFKSE